MLIIEFSIVYNRDHDIEFWINTRSWTNLCGVVYTFLKTFHSKSNPSSARRALQQTFLYKLNSFWCEKDLKSVIFLNFRNNNLKSQILCSAALVNVVCLLRLTADQKNGCLATSNSSGNYIFMIYISFSFECNQRLYF